MPWCSARTSWPAIVTRPMLKNAISGSAPPVAFWSTSSAVGPCTWKRKIFRPPVGFTAVRSSRSTVTS